MVSKHQFLPCLFLGLLPTIVYMPLWRIFRIWTKEAINVSFQNYIFKTDDRRLHQVVVVLLNRRCLFFWKGKNNLLQIIKRTPRYCLQIYFANILINSNLIAVLW